MVKKARDFTSRKLKNPNVNQNQLDVKKHQKKLQIDNVSDSQAHGLKAMFEKLKPQKANLKISTAKLSGDMKEPKLEKKISPERANINFEKKKKLAKKRKQIISEMEEESSSEIPNVSPKALKKKKLSLVSIPEQSDLNYSLGKEEKKLKYVQQDRRLQRSNAKIIKQRAREEKERMNRTLFVGNLPMNITRKSLQKLFSEFGSVESVRLRGAVPKKERMPRKITEIRRDFHAGLQSRKGFIVFKNEVQAKGALSLNGKVIEDHHIIVNPASNVGEKKMYDDKRTIFIGNLPFGIQDEAVWSSFAQFGDVEAVRVIRDNCTGAGKGFGYVLFHNTEAKQNALGQESIKIENRTIRIKNVEGGKKGNSSKQHNIMKSRAINLRRKNDRVNSRKSLKKIMKKEKISYEKKKVINSFKKFF